MPINPDLYAAFVAATVILVIIPGPNVTLIVANAVARGPAAGLTSVAGTGAAQVLQLAVTALGLSSFMLVLAEGFEVLRWLGVAYLLWLGLRQFRAPAHGLEDARVARSNGRRLFWQGFLVSWTNPKTLVFYAAFFPQFVDPALPPGPQLWLLSATFFVIAVTLDSSYALLAARLRGLLSGQRGASIRNRLTGGLLIGAGLGLALVKRN